MKKKELQQIIGCLFEADHKDLAKVFASKANLSEETEKKLLSPKMNDTQPPIQASTKKLKYIATFRTKKDNFLAIELPAMTSEQLKMNVQYKRLIKDHKYVGTLVPVIAATIKPEQIYRKAWPEIWSYIIDAFNFVKDASATKQTPYILVIQGTKKLIFQDAIKRIDADMPSTQDWKDTDRMFPNFRKEYEMAKKIAKGKV